MKKLGVFGKFLFFINSVFAFLLLLGYLLPYIPPSVFPKIAVLSLLVPVLIIINTVFLVYWIFRFKRAFLVSAIVLVAGFNHILGLYQLGSESEENVEGLKILSYNVHTYNEMGWTTQKNIGEKIITFIEGQNPDIVCIQEHNAKYHLDTSLYPYSFKKMINVGDNFGHITYSKYPIINSGAFNFKKSGNNILFTDIIFNKDTLRVYNVHFQSLRLSTQFKDLQKEDSDKLLSRIGRSFVKQEEQLMEFLEHEKTAPFPVIVTGDFNNSATSYLYRKVRGEKEDAFAKAGSGTGSTFTFDFIPLRIDFILSDTSWEAVSFKNYDINYSDHKPIMATFTKAE